MYFFKRSCDQSQLPVGNVRVIPATAKDNPETGQFYKNPCKLFIFSTLI